MTHGLAARHVVKFLEKLGRSDVSEDEVHAGAKVYGGGDALGRKFRVGLDDAQPELLVLGEWFDPRNARAVIARANVAIGSVEAIDANVRQVEEDGLCAHQERVALDVDVAMRLRLQVDGGVTIARARRRVLVDDLLAEIQRGRDYDVIVAYNGGSHRCQDLGWPRPRAIAF